MKQLKFMLAAATAIGLAAAAQAATTQLVKTEISSESFDDPNIALTNTAAVLALGGFTFEGAEVDNDSVVVAGGANGSANALQVNTGTDPLLRKIDTDTDNAVSLDATKKVYIDTMVQFTVTPYGDTVSSNGVNDKLMIYLKEMTNLVNGVVTVTGTNLMVKAAHYVVGMPPAAVESFNEVDVKITNVSVEPNEWYRLQVDSYLLNGIAVFTIKLDDTELVAEQELYNSDTGKKVFPSLLGKTSATLDKVGFAGEGMVDDLVFSKDVEQETSADFTFVVKWDTGISAVTYTISEDGTTSEAAPVPADGFSVPKGATVELAVTLADPDWTKLADGTVLKWTEVAADNKGIELTTVKITSKPSTDGGVVLNPNATVPEIQASAEIKNGYFAGEGVTKDELTTVLNWKAKKGGSKADINNISFVAEGVGAGDPETADAKAYLLDCDVDDVETEIKKFTFKGFSLDESGKPVFGVGKAGVEAPTVGNGGEYGNGHVEIRGKQYLDDANWDKGCAKPNFFRAFLVK